jgi:nucleoid-associated protein YgaU
VAEQVVRRRRVLLAVGSLLLGYLPAAGLLLWGTTGALTTVGAAGPADPGAVVALAAALAAWAVLTWLTVVTVAALATAAVAGVGSRAHAVALSLAPGTARRIVSAALGLVLVGAPIAAALPADARVAGALTAADRADHPDHVGHADHALRQVDLPAAPVPDRPAATVPTGWTPDRPVRTHRRAARSEAAARLVTGPSRAERRVADEVVVRRGDTLWDIAARQLGPDASAADVAAEWPRWHRANREVIGSDPDLLLPGQRLVPPAGH